MIELVEGHWIAIEDIKAVKRISEKKCTVWVVGIEPMVLDCPAEEVLDVLGYEVGDADEEEGGEGDDD